MVTRRRLLTGLLSMAAGVFSVRSASSAENNLAENELRFPGDPTDHNVVYQLNKPNDKYHDAVLFSVAEMLRKYGDNITIVVTAFGPGIHVLAKIPTRPVSEKNMQSVQSLTDYGVKFHACGNTLKTTGLRLH